jgi:hypothetical protein
MVNVVAINRATKWRPKTDFPIPGLPITRADRRLHLVPGMSFQFRTSVDWRKNDLSMRRCQKQPQQELEQEGIIQRNRVTNFSVMVSAGQSANNACRAEHHPQCRTNPGSALAGVHLEIRLRPNERSGDSSRYDRTAYKRTHNSRRP